MIKNIIVIPLPLTWFILILYPQEFVGWYVHEARAGWVGNLGRHQQIQYHLQSDLSHMIHTLVVGPNFQI